MLLASALVVSLTQPLKATSIDEEKKKQEELEDELNDVQGTLDELESLKNDMNAYIATMDAKLNQINDHITDLNNQAAAKQAEIDETNSKLAAQEEDINSQYESMKKRIKFMYENGQTEYLEMMLGSDSLGDFLNKAEYISQITEYDRGMLDKMRQTKAEIEETKNSLVTEQANLDALLKEAETEQASVEELKAAKEKQLAETQSQINDTADSIKDKQDEIAAQQAIVEELEELERKRKEEEEKRRQEEELKKQQAAQNGTSYEVPVTPSYDGGQFKWPLPGYYTITSEYGNRNDPINGQLAFHSGLDIAAPNGTPIVAAYGGTVAWAYYSSSAGNWIGIDHGDGIYTVYMHMSGFAASTGDVVSAGDVIGYVGSTGRSTGNHLHFSVRLNGTYVNPHNYVG